MTPSSSTQTLSDTTQDQTSMSTALEQDFTVEGKKGHLQCPFSTPASCFGTNDGQSHSRHSLDTTPHQSADPICAAMFEEATSQAAANGVGVGDGAGVAAAAAAAAASSGSSKCPIRFMDKHSAEEIAHYVETHKHALPRSHEVCLRRYQRNETQMKKMDSKYGNIVSMIEGLSHIHQPMLPGSDGEDQGRAAAADKDDGDDSNERVQHWARSVSRVGGSDDVNELVEPADQDRTSHFERPLKEVRVGESPSRPWGISVPVYDAADGREGEYPLSPPPAPVRMSNPGHGDLPPAARAGSTPGKCPFDHGKFSGAAPAGRPPSTPNPAAKSSDPIRGFDETPFAFTHVDAAAAAATDAATATAAAANPAMAAPPSSRPIFINPQAVKAAPGGGVPQMVFTGPVFIGYPMEQAIEIMNQWRGPQ
ncbi:hypothetical protein E4U53_006990 [Claviceps sorghi]|nr:hypothetical protein E4U53_006990 [Claviceps sorghi]